VDDPIFILLGSNLNDQLGNLAEARLQISRLAGQVITTSSIYKTAAWGNSEQPDFYNQVIELRTSLSPEKLLATILTIESAMGRIRDEKWGARIIDIDILFWGGLIVQQAHLTIPHPQIPNRKFTLIPLNEIAPEFLHPTLNKKVSELLEDCQDKLEVEKL
jgi:2-amino-4-hydroxy-6-hydroxymethyldihydropteridine diphosphokinase